MRLAVTAALWEGAVAALYLYLGLNLAGQLDAVRGNVWVLAVLELPFCAALIARASRPRAPAPPSAAAPAPPSAAATGCQLCLAASAGTCVVVAAIIYLMLGIAYNSSGKAFGAAAVAAVVVPSAFFASLAVLLCYLAQRSAGYKDEEQALNYYKAALVL
jgi:hypothetical protein